MRDLVFTGDHPEFIRRELQKLAERAGHKVRKQFCSKTNLVVATYQAAKNGTTKYRKAAEADVRIMGVEEFLAQVELL
jgi:NAD-dependent DNA ligase